MAALFAEELSIVIEVAPENVATVAAAYAAAGVTATPLATATADTTRCLPAQSACMPACTTT